jgi:hypothetical protein
MFIVTIHGELNSSYIIVSTIHFLESNFPKFCVLLGHSAKDK